MTPRHRAVATICDCPASSCQDGCAETGRIDVMQLKDHQDCNTNVAAHAQQRSTNQEMLHVGWNASHSVRVPQHCAPCVHPLSFSGRAFFLKALNSEHWRTAGRVGLFMLASRLEDSLKVTGTATVTGTIEAQFTS